MRPVVAIVAAVAVVTGVVAWAAPEYDGFPQTRGRGGAGSNLSGGGSVGGCVFNGNSSIECAAATLGIVDAGVARIGHLDAGVIAVRAATGIECAVGITAADAFRAICLDRVGGLSATVPYLGYNSGTLALTIASAGDVSLAPASGSAVKSTATSGSNAYAVNTSGARVDFGAGANDYASSDGTTVTFAGPVAVTGKASITSNATTCTLDGASPSTCTATVTASAKCTCSPIGATAAIAAGGCAVGLSGTTLTVTSANGLTNVVNIFCDR